MIPCSKRDVCCVCVCVCVKRRGEERSGERDNVDKRNEVLMNMYINKENI